MYDTASLSRPPTQPFLSLLLHNLILLFLGCKTSMFTSLQYLVVNDNQISRVRLLQEARPALSPSSTVMAEPVRSFY